jgi:hypothetical protein
MRKRRSVYHVFRPALIRALDPVLIERSLTLYPRIDVHAISHAARDIQMLVTASSRPQLAGFLQHFFRALSASEGGRVYIGRAQTTRVLTQSGVALLLADMHPFLLPDVRTVPLPVRYGGPPPQASMFAC